MPTVSLFRDFIEDNRASMEVYANQLLAALRDHEGDEYREFRPRLGAISSLLPNAANLRMRYARYVDYPLQVPNKNSDVYHILDHGYAHLMQRLDPEKTILTVHDTIPILAGRGLIPGVQGRHSAWLSEWSAKYYKKAKRIIAISKSTRDDLTRLCGCDEENIKVIYFGIDEKFHPLDEVTRENLRRELGLPKKPCRLVLITGQQFYKNQETSVKVYKQYRNKIKYPARLIRMGRVTPEWEGICRKEGIVDEVINFDSLTADLVPFLYNCIDCLLFPSWYEGFGLPPLEVMACGVPVVTSNVASLPEAVGDAGVMHDPEDIDGMAESLERLVCDDDYRRTKIEAGLLQAGKFSWQKNAQQVREIYHEIAA